ncbi:MAG: hypothetical protein ACK5IC_02855 [Moheibacter sp.]
MIRTLFFLLLPLASIAQTAEISDFLTSGTWNIAYNITPEGEQIDEESQEKIRSNWVTFYENGTYEVPGGISGKIRGQWKLNPETSAIHFTEKGTKYRAIIEEISDMNLVLHYVDNGGFKIGLIHHVNIPKPKTNDEITAILTSGKWNITIKRFEEFDDRTPTHLIADTWYLFNSDGTYQHSEQIGEEIILNNGTWFLDKSNQLNLDFSENTIYTVMGDKSILILTTVTNGVNTIEMRKAKD